jgi:sugar (pentulose or hexulose) kinase
MAHLPFGERMVKTKPRSIAVVDIGYTNTKVMLFDASLNLLGERKMVSPHHQGKLYREIDVEPMLAFFAKALPELDAMAPIDAIVTTSHGACIVAAKADGSTAVPIMDYMSDPPAPIVAAYTAAAPTYAETYSPQLPVALLHSMQLFWQQQALPQAFAETRYILPLMQYVGWRLGARPVTEISSMGCQSHLLDLNTLGPSSLAISKGWAEKFAPRAKAWDVVGTLHANVRGTNFRGRGDILAGVHDSNANYLRYLAGGLTDFTLLSTGTWIIGFDTAADVRKLNPDKDIVASVDVMSRRVACCRFFGGKEFEIVSKGSSGSEATLKNVQKLIENKVMALPSFTDSGGPMPGTGGQGKIVGTVETPEDHASLASLYCAMMVSESLDAIHSAATIIVDGPFSQNQVFLAMLSALRPAQKVRASNLRDGTTAGAAILALMPDGLLPHIDISMGDIPQATLPGLAAYHDLWKRKSAQHV